MLHSRWQLAVSDKPIHVNSNLNGCYAAAAATGLPAASASYAEGVSMTPSLRQLGLHTGLTLATMDAFDVRWLKIRGEVKPSAASRSQAPVGLRKRRRKDD